MALNDIQLTSGLSVTSGGETYSSTATSSFSSAEDTFECGLKVEQSVTTIEAVYLGDINLAKEHFIHLRNENASHHVTVTLHASGSVSTVAGIMRAGESFGPIRCPVQDAGYPCYKMTSSSGTCKVVVTAGTAGVYVPA